MEKKYIGIIRRNGLGDVLCSLPLVLYCKEKHPDSSIVLFVDERAAPLAPYLIGPDVVEIIPHHSNKYWAILKAAWRGRKYNFEWIFSAKPMPMKLINWFLFLLKGKKKRAYVQAGWHAKLVSHPIPFPFFSSTHQALRTLLLIEPGLKEIPQRLFPRLKNIPLRENMSHGAPILLVSMTNNRIGSLLDIDKYVRILTNFSKKKVFFVLISCEPQDAIRAQALKEALSLPSEVRPTAQLDDFLKLIAQSTALFIGDGGIMHLAAALDKPQVVLFGGTDVSEWAPLSAQAICLSHPENVNDIPEENILAALESIL